MFIQRRETPMHSGDIFGSALDEGGMRLGDASMACDLPIVLRTPQGLGENNQISPARPYKNYKVSWGQRAV